MLLMDYPSIREEEGDKYHFILKRSYGAFCMNIYMENKGTVTVEVHPQLRNDLINIKSKKTIRNHPLIHAIIIISVMNLTIRNQIRASDVDRRIISLQIFQNWTL